MDRTDLAAFTDTNYFESFRAMSIAAGSPVSDTGRVLCVSTGAPVAFLNIAFVTRPLGDPERELTAAMAFFDELGLPFVVRVREGVDPAAEAAAEALGMPYSDTVPGMALFPVGPPPANPPGLRIERAGDRAGLAAFQRVMAAGFGMPIDIARRLITLATLDVPGIECYLGYVDGEPVTSSTLCRTGRTAGVYNVATIESHRKRGLGEAMTWHAVTRGAQAGCDVAILQASEMGRPIYERMGFRLVAPYRTFHRPGY